MIRRNDIELYYIKDQNKYEFIKSTNNKDEEVASFFYNCIREKKEKQLIFINNIIGFFNHDPYAFYKRNLLKEYCPITYNS